MNKKTTLRSLLLYAGLVVSGCGPSGDTVTVEVCGDVLVPQEVHNLRITVLDEGRTLRQEGIVDVLECPGEVVNRLPIQVEVARIAGSSWVGVEAIRDGVRVGSFERRARLDSYEGILLLGLTRDCLGQSCALGQTCIDGLCQAAPFETGGSICSGTAVAEPMVDAGPDVDEDASGEQADVGAEEGDAGEAEPDSPGLCPPEGLGGGAAAGQEER